MKFFAYNAVSSSEYLQSCSLEDDAYFVVNQNVDNKEFTELLNIPMSPIPCEDAQFVDNQGSQMEMFQEQPIQYECVPNKQKHEVEDGGYFEFLDPIAQEQPNQCQHAQDQDHQDAHQDVFNVPEAGYLQLADASVQLPQPSEEYQYLPFQPRQAPTKATKARKSDEVMMCILELHQQYQHSGIVFKTADLIRLSGLDVAPRRIHDVMPPFELLGMVERRTKGEYEFKPKRQMEPLEEGAMTEMLKTIVKYVEVFKTIGGHCKNYSATNFAKAYGISPRRIYDVQTALKYLGVMHYDTKRKTATLL